MRLIKNALVLALVGSLTATAALAAEGSGGVRGGGGTEIDFLSQVPDQIEYRAVFRWPTALIPNLKLPHDRYALEFQIRKVFRKAEIAQPNRGWTHEFYARPQRRQGEWTRIQPLELVTPLTLIRWLKDGSIDRHSLDRVQRAIRSGVRYYVAPGWTSHKMFMIAFKPLSTDESIKARLYPFDYDALGYGQWGRSIVSESVDYLINGNEVAAWELSKLQQSLTDIALQMVVYEKPETASAMVFWARMSKDLDLQDPTWAFFYELKAKLGRQAEALTFRALDTVTPTGSCNTEAFGQVEADVRNWLLVSDEYYADLRKSGIDAFYQIDKFLSDDVVPLKSLVNTALSLVRSYCVSDSNAQSQTDRALLFEQIQAQKAQFKLGDFVKEQ